MKLNREWDNRIFTHTPNHLIDSIKIKDYSAEKRLSLRSSLILIESKRLRLCEATMTGKMKKEIREKYQLGE